MTLLPIVERELRIRARSAGTLRTRLTVALGSILIVAGLLAFSQVVFNPARVGHMMFLILSGLAMIGCLLEGLRVTADCLSGEKRQGTLGLLFLTDLRGYDVVLGKFVAVSLDSVYSLLALFPALAIPLVLGGVTGGELWRMMLVLAHTLFFSLSVGMLVSALSYEERHAWTITLVALLVVAVAPVLEGLGASGAAVMWTLASPTAVYLAAFDPAYMASPSSFWISVGLLHGCAWVALGLASLLLPGAWQGEDVRRRRAPLRQAGTHAEPRRGWRARLSLRRPRQPASGPAWLVGLGRDSSVGMHWLGAGLALAGLAWWGLASGFDPALGIAFLAFALVLHLFLASWVAVEACHAMHRARESGMLELLLTTPLTIPAIARGFHQGLWRHFSRPVMLLLVVEVAGLVAFLLLRTAGNEDPAEALGHVMIGMLVLGISLLDLEAAGSYGLWMGLKTPKPSHAIAKTLVCVIWGPALLGFCCPVLLAAVKNIYFISIGNDHLLRKMRPVLTGWYDQPGGTRRAEKASGTLPPVLPSARSIQDKE